MSTFRYRLAGVSASHLDKFIEAGSGATADLLARPPWTEVTLVDNSRQPDLDECMARLGYVPDTTGPVVVASMNHTMGTESVVLVDASGGPIQVDVPLTTARFGDELVVMKTDSSTNAVTVMRSGADTVDGAVSQSLTLQGDAIRIISDAATTNWNLIASRRVVDIGYDSSSTVLTSTNVQDALDEILTQDLGSIEVFIAGEALSVGHLVTLNTAGEVVRASSSIAGGIWEVVGVSRETVILGASVQVYTKSGSSPATRFGAAPAMAQNGSTVFLDSTSGLATLTPPTATGNAVFAVGVLRGADGVSFTPTVVFRPQVMALRT